MKPVYLLIACFLFWIQPADALLRHSNKPVNEQTNRQTTDVLEQAGRDRVPTLETGRFRRPRPGQNPYDNYTATTPGTFSFVCAMLSLACLGAVGITSFSLIMIPAFVFATLAAVFGAIGIRRLKRGYAIVGLTLGLLAMVGGFMMLALFL